MNKDKKTLFDNPTSEEQKENKDLNSNLDGNSNLDNKNQDVNEVNSTFFEKFEKTKKDFVKEKKLKKAKAQKSLRIKNKILGFENKLRDDEFVKNSWIAFVSIGIFIVAYCCVCLGFMATKFTSTSDAKWQVAVGIPDNGNMLKTIVIFSSIVLILVPIPYIYLLGSWFVGINGTFKSKVFFLVTFSLMVIATVLFLIILPMSAYLFAKVNNFSELINPIAPPDSGGGEGDGTTPQETQSLIYGINYLFSTFTWK